jgi:outer membrane lipoprotein carrier protein
MAILKTDSERNPRSLTAGRFHGKAVRRTVLVWVTLALLFPSMGKAQAPDLDQVIAKVQETYQGIQDLSARFQQVSLIKGSPEKEESSGVVLLKKPGMMRWEYKSPEPRLIVCDGKTLYIYSPADQQVLVQEATKAFTSSTVNLLAGMGKLREDFLIQWGKTATKGSSGALLLELKPVQSGGQIEGILMEIRPQTYLVERMVLKDIFSNTTTLSFKKVKVNTGLSDSLFTFVPPPGTQVIKGPPGAKKP